MSPEDRQLRADAARNRRQLLDAAAAVFAERGLEVSVTEIAQRAGLGRGTLFRNFATKEDLIAAIVVERMREAAAAGRELLDDSDPGAALFGFVEEMVGRQQVNRSLFEAVQDAFLANAEIRNAHAEVVGVLEALLGRAQAAGAVRPDVGGMDVLILMKGVCEAASAFAHIDSGLVNRQLDLIRAALAPTAGALPLRGRTPTLDDIRASFPADPAATDPVARSASS